MSYFKLVLISCFIFFGCSSSTDKIIIEHIAKYCILQFNPLMEKGCQCIAKEVLQRLTQKEKDDFARASESRKKALGRMYFEQSSISEDIKLMCLSKSLRQRR